MGLYGGYIRVSRVGDREETLISPKLQRRQIKAWAGAHGHKVVALPDELDASGADDSRPILTAAIEQIERGELDGIVVAKFDRLTRSLPSSVRMLERIEAAGGEVRSASEQLDASTTEGRMTRNILFSVAQAEREGRADGFERAKADAIARGVYIAGRVPFGYRKGPDRKLVIEPQEAKVVRAMYRKRIAGAPWREVGKLMEPLCGQVMPARARETLRNPVYKGEARQGKHRNPSAHKPIVDLATWEAAQVEGRRPHRSGKSYLLSGLVRCAGCSRTMTPTRTAYRCRRYHSGGTCPEPASIMAGRIEPFVEAAVLEHLSQVRADARERDSLVESATDNLAGAEDELRAYQRAVRVSELGADAFEAGMRERVVAVEREREELARVRAAAVAIPGPANLRSTWAKLSVGDRNHVLRGALGVVWVAKGSAPLAERVRLVARGHEPGDLGLRGFRRVPVRRAVLNADLPGEIRAVPTEDA